MDSIDDAVTCLLTRGLGYLIAGRFVVTRAEKLSARLRVLVPLIPDHVCITHSRQASAGSFPEEVFECDHTVLPARSRRLSRDVYEIVRKYDGRRSLGELLEPSGVSGDGASVTKDFETLWTQRLIRLVPSVVARRTYSETCSAGAAATQNELAFAADLAASR